MALALADSLGYVGWDPVDQMHKYINWMEKGHYTIPGYCFDIGNKG
jgi:ADP-ribosyl-[dinitrogen reductase] hydrolase